MIAAKKACLSEPFNLMSNTKPAVASAASSLAPSQLKPASHILRRQSSDAKQQKSSDNAARRKSTEDITGEQFSLTNFYANTFYPVSPLAPCQLKAAFHIKTDNHLSLSSKNLPLVM